MPLPAPLQYLALLLPLTTLAQSVHLTGTVDLSVQEGTLTADITMSSLPPQIDYSILLNGGLNVKRMTDSTGELGYSIERDWDGEVSFEAFHYWLPTSDRAARFLPPNLRLQYTGKFPVYRDTTEMTEWDDWKGNIAFNGRTVRATEQSVWYPVFYDRVTGELHTAVTYDLEINCADCSAIYLGGSDPQESSQVRLRSDQPAELMLFAGDFELSQRGAIAYINADLDAEQEQAVTDTTRAIQAYYADLLGMPYGKTITYLQATPVAKRPEWSFVSFPTFARVGREYTFSRAIDSSGRVKEYDVATMAHELAHYYFGSAYRPSGPLFWPLLEGTTEYLALQYVRDHGTAEAYQRKLAGYAEVSKGESGTDFPSLTEVTTRSQLDERYRYNLFPLLLTRLEETAGRAAVLEFLRGVLNSGVGEANYAFLLDQLAAAGIDQESFETVEKKVLNEVAPRQ
ncbi:hypothetical protein [Neolewinella sp.]|uniref:hypothetical protein n=1 Tax=Neolewinella sp. TaxID=2993543 RepID=UPI003B51B6DE